MMSKELTETVHVTQNILDIADAYYLFQNLLKNHIYMGLSGQK